MLDSTSIRTRDAAALLLGGPALVFVALTGYGFDGVRAGKWSGAVLLLILGVLFVAKLAPRREGEARSRSRPLLLALLVPFLVVFVFFAWFAYALAQDTS